MGDWLKRNGDAIYNSVPWIYQNDTVTPDVWYTTQKPGNGRRNVYAMVLNYPYAQNSISLHALNGHIDETSKVHLLGYNTPLLYFQESNSILIKFPNKQDIDAVGLDLVWTLKIDIPYTK